MIICEFFAEIIQLYFYCVRSGMQVFLTPQFVLTLYPRKLRNGNVAWNMMHMSKCIQSQYTADKFQDAKNLWKQVGWSWRQKQK